MSIFKQWWKTFAPNPLDKIIEKAKRKGSKSFLIAWNRGVGDIPLGLYAVVARIREKIPDAQIAFQTRPDLLEGFSLLDAVSAFADSSWKRGTPIPSSSLLHPAFDIVIAKPDPTYWVNWQIGNLVPRLRWKTEWDTLSEKYALPQECIGIHVQTETSYSYEKNWPEEKWRALFEKLSQPIVLFGMRPEPVFPHENIFDLRGKTGILDMLSIIKNHCRVLIAPDSGVLSLTYFLDVAFPITVVSLWADPRQGVLKQNVPSPNPQLIHRPLLGSKELLSNISLGEVLHALH